jgi:hypothetical protein
MDQFTLVLLESPPWVWVHWVGFIMFPPTMEMLLNIEQFSYLKIHFKSKPLWSFKVIFFVFVCFGDYQSREPSEQVPPVYNGGISPGQKWWQTFWNIWGGPKGVPNSTLLWSLMFCPKSSSSHLYMGAKGEGTPSFHIIFYNFNIFLWWANQIGSLQKNKRSCPSFGIFFFANNLKNSQQGTSW